MRTSFNSHIALFLKNQSHSGPSGNGPIGSSDTVTFHSSVPVDGKFSTVFVSEFSVLEHYTKPQRPNVFSEEFGLCFWLKTLRNHLVFIYPHLRMRKDERKENWGLWVVQKPFKHTFLSGENVLCINGLILWLGLI